MALPALIAMTAIWGVTFVQVKDAVALYPLFAFLAVRFAIATLTLAVPGTRRVRSLGSPGIAAGALLGLLLAAGYALQTAGLERPTVSVPIHRKAVDPHVSGFLNLTSKHIRVHRGIANVDVLAVPKPRLIVGENP